MYANNTNNTNITLTPEWSDTDDTVTPFLSIMVFTTAVMATMLNLPVLLIMLHRKCKGKRITNIHILSLSISDLLTSINIIPIYQSYTEMATKVSYTDCSLRILLFLIALVASVVHLLFICADRCLILCYRTSTFGRKSKIRFWIIIGAAWIISPIIMGTPFAVHMEEKTVPYCSFSTIFRNRGKIILKWWSILLLGTTLFIMASCAWMIWKINRYCANKVTVAPKQSKIHIIPVSSSTFSEESPGCVTEMPVNRPGRQSVDLKQKVRDTDSHGLDRQIDRLRERLNRNNHLSRTGIWQGRGAVFERESRANQQPASQSSLRFHRSWIHDRKLRQDAIMEAFDRRTTYAKHHVKAVITIVILVCLFVLTITPMMVMILFMEGWFDIAVPRQTRHGVMYFTCMNSSFNPIIYAFRIPEIRGFLRYWNQRIKIKCHCTKAADDPDMN